MKRKIVLGLVVALFVVSIIVIQPFIEDKEVFFEDVKRGA